MHDTHKDKCDVGIRKNVGGKYPTKLNKFGMKTKKRYDTQEWHIVEGISVRI